MASYALTPISSSQVAQTTASAVCGLLWREGRQTGVVRSLLGWRLRTSPPTPASRRSLPARRDQRFKAQVHVGPAEYWAICAVKIRPLGVAGVSRLGRDSQLCWSRAFAGTLVFSKEAPDILARPGPQPHSAGGARGEASLGPRVSDRRQEESRASRSCRSAVSWRLAGSSSMLVMLRRRGSSSVSIGFLVELRAASVLREPPGLPGPAGPVG